MKTPEQIKAELNDALPVHFHKGDPEPRLTPFNYHALEDLHADAFALIEQLEDDKDELLEKVEQLEEDIKNIREGKPEGAVALVGRELLARLQAKIPRWISVEERLPETREWVMVIGKFVPEGGWFVPRIAEYYRDSWRLDDDEYSYPEDRHIEVTHWMPLPEPPMEDAT